MENYNRPHPPGCLCESCLEREALRIASEGDWE